MPKFRNLYHCDKCILINYVDEEIIKERNCKKCGSKLRYLSSIEYDNQGKGIREYKKDGSVIEYKKSKNTPCSRAKQPTITCPYCNSMDCKKLVQHPLNNWPDI